MVKSTRQINNTGYRNLGITHFTCNGPAGKQNYHYKTFGTSNSHAVGLPANQRTFKTPISHAMGLPEKKVIIIKTFKTPLHM